MHPPVRTEPEGRVRAKVRGGGGRGGVLGWIYPGKVSMIVKLTGWLLYSWPGCWWSTHIPHSAVGGSLLQLEQCCTLTLSHCSKEARQCPRKECLFFTKQGAMATNLSNCLSVKALDKSQTSSLPFSLYQSDGKFSVSNQSHCFSFLVGDWSLDLLVVARTNDFQRVSGYQGHTWENVSINR